jgi:glycosyltransferase involved in cell wall biosynthesis
MSEKRLVYSLMPYQGASGKHGTGRVAWEIFRKLLNKLDDSWEIVVIFSSNLDLKRGVQIAQEIKKIRKGVEIELFDANGFSNYFEMIKRGEDYIAYELALEHFVSQLSPTHYFNPSHFELDHPTSLGKLKISGSYIILYDLIPYLFREQYLRTEFYKKWYFNKLREVANADFFFAVSSQTKKDFANNLHIDPARIFVTPLDASEAFRRLSEEERNTGKEILEKFNIQKPYILYVPSGYDFRKNIEKLIEAFSKLPSKIRENYQLVLTSEFPPEIVNLLYGKARSLGLNREDIVFTGYVSDKDLCYLYNLAELFVYPSLYEGFGLPVLEAMRCGCPVIGSDSVSEIIEEKYAIFDPNNVDEIARVMYKALTDESFRRLLIENSERQQKKFSWDRSIDIIVSVLEMGVK